MNYIAYPDLMTNPKAFAYVAKYKGEYFKSLKEHAEEIFAAINTHLGIDAYKLRSDSRKREIVEARQIFMYLMKEKTPKTSLREIGELVEKDHSTVIYAINMVKNTKQIQDKLRLVTGV